MPLLDLNPFNDLGDAVRRGAADGWTAAMVSLWQAGLWLLDAAFALLDRFLTPDLADPGLADIYRVCLWLSLLLALVLGLGQVGLAAVRRDGSALGRTLVGVAQYGAVLACWTVVGAALVWATAGLTRGLLDATLGVRDFGGVTATAGWPTRIGGATAATALGLSSMLLLFPAALGYVLVMLVREAALVVIAVTLPISAAGVLGDATRAWFWKALRWFLASCLIAPLMALVLGVGVQVSRAAFPDAPRPRSGALRSAAAAGAVPASESAVGMAVVGCVIVVIACFSPMVLFRLLAFVDPGTGSGATMRASLAANGGLGGLLSRGTGAGAAPATGSGAATMGDDSGRAAGEATADTLTERRFPAMVGRVAGPAGGVVGAAMGSLGTVARAGSSLGADVLGATGVGPSGHYPAPDPGPRRPRPSRVGPPSPRPAPADTPGGPDADDDATGRRRAARAARSRSAAGRGRGRRRRGGVPRMTPTYGAAATRERQGWFLGLTGPQVTIVIAAGLPVWLTAAVGAWTGLLVWVPVWALVVALACVPVRGWTAAQWVGVLARYLVGARTGWSDWQSRVAAGDLDDLEEADLPGVLAGIQVHDGPPLRAPPAGWR